MDSKSKWERVDPALRGGQPPFAHKLDSWQMEAVAAICDTFVPALPMKALEHDDESASIARFCRTSASDAGIPEEVAGLISKCLDPQVARTVEWTLLLWLLATRMGTLLLCGKAALCGGFPYVQRFAAMPLENRERALVSWSTGSVRRMQSLFKLFKCYCLWAFYSKADENGRNDAVWDAIGYPAPDPSWNGLSSPCSKNAEEIPPPLQVFDVEQASSASSSELVKLLSAAGCSVRVLEQQERTLGAAGAEEALLPEVAIDCDVVVAGSGCGGGVLAAALAEKGHKVVVLDKGKYFAGEQLSLLEGPSMKAMYENAGMLATLDGGINFLAAATVGGGSAINWSASFRSPQNVLHEWAAEHGLGLFGSDEYRSAMDRVCERLGVQVYSKREQELRLPEVRESFQNAVLRKGCERMGYHVESIPRNCKGEEHACGMCGLGCKSRQKQGTTETWLVDAVAAGAVILSGCRAERIVLHSEESSKKPWRARGVVASSSTSGRRFLIRAKATVSACGSLHTPLLLRRSGLSNRHVGSNLHLHPTQMVWGYFPPDGPEGRVFEGPIMTAISKVAESSGAVLEVPALPPGTFAGMTPWRSGSEFKERMLGYSRTAHIIVIVRDSGSGTVRESNAAPGGEVLPSVCYRLMPEDEERLKEGAERALRVLIAAGAEEVGTQHPDCERLRVVGGVRDESEIEGFLRRVRAKGLTSAAMSIGTAHQMGSCRMGVDSAVSAVDPRGETWECSGLFVADASVFPTALGINPMITVQSVALCVANSVHAHLKNSW